MSFYTVQRRCHTALPTVRTRAHYRISGTISHNHNHNMPLYSAFYNTGQRYLFFILRVTVFRA